MNDSTVDYFYVKYKSYMNDDQQILNIIFLLIKKLRFWNYFYS